MWTCVDDPDADFVDLFERYGFFDASSVLHTAEVHVPAATWACEERDGNGSDAGDCDGAWRRELISAQAAVGCDAEFDAWWVPDTALEACPLFAAVRATLVGTEEMRGVNTPSDAASVLCKPIAREAEARAKLASILRHHLAGYTCTPERAAADLTSGRLTAAETSATRLLLFETQLLNAALASLLSRDVRGQ